MCSLCFTIVHCLNHKTVLYLTIARKTTFIRTRRINGMLFDVFFSLVQRAIFWHNTAHVQCRSRLKYCREETYVVDTTHPFVNLSPSVTKCLAQKGNALTTSSPLIIVLRCLESVIGRRDYAEKRRMDEAEIISADKERKEASTQHSRVGANNLLPIASRLLKSAVYVDFKGLRNVRTLFSVITAILWLGVSLPRLQCLLATMIVTR